MATAEKVFQLGTPQTTSGLFQGVVGFFASVLGCWHREMSRPFTRQGQTYRTCLGCGAKRRFDLRSWETKGGFYYVA